MCAIGLLFCINVYRIKSAKCQEQDLVLHLECSDTMCIKRSAFTFAFSSSNIVRNVSTSVHPSHANVSIAFTTSFWTARRAVIGTVLVLM